MWLVRNPEWFDVVVTSNMFGDIVTDLGSVLQGGMGMAASANVGDDHGMFEPVHGSSPKHAGQNKVNPIASILSVHYLLIIYVRLHQRDSGFLCSCHPMRIWVFHCFQFQLSKHF